MFRGLLFVLFFSVLGAHAVEINPELIECGGHPGQVEFVVWFNAGQQDSVDAAQVIKLIVDEGYTVWRDNALMYSFRVENCEDSHYLLQSMNRRILTNDSVNTVFPNLRVGAE